MSRLGLAELTTIIVEQTVHQKAISRGFLNVSFVVQCDMNLVDLSRGLRTFFPAKVSLEEAKDTGMAMTVLSLLVGIAGAQKIWLFIALVLLLANMVRPSVYTPVARIWLGLSRLLGTLTSKAVLTTLFILLVIPVGLLRRIMGKDSLQLKEWKRGNGSVFRIRDHKYTSDDIMNPY